MRDQIPKIPEDVSKRAAQYAAERNLDGLVQLLQSDECRNYLEYLVREELRRFPDEKTMSKNPFHKRLQDEYGASPHVNARICRVLRERLDEGVEFAYYRATKRECLQAELDDLAKSSEDKAKSRKDKQFKIGLWLRGHAKYALLLYLVYFARELAPYAYDAEAINSVPASNPSAGDVQPDTTSSPTASQETAESTQSDDLDSLPVTEIALRYWKIPYCTPIIKLAYFACRNALKKQCPALQDRWKKHNKALAESQEHSQSAEHALLTVPQAASKRQSSAPQSPPATEAEDVQDRCTKQNEALAGSQEQSQSAEHAPPTVPRAASKRESFAPQRPPAIEAEVVQDQFQIYREPQLSRTLIEQDPNELLKMCIQDALMLAFENFNEDFWKYETRRGFRFDKWFYRSIAPTSVRQTIKSLLPHPTEDKSTEYSAKTGVRRAKQSPLPHPTEEPNTRMRVLSTCSDIVENFKRSVSPEEFLSYISKSQLISDEEKVILHLYHFNEVDDRKIAELLGIGKKNPEAAVRRRRSDINKKLARALLLDFALKDDLTRKVVALIVQLHPQYPLNEDDEEAALQKGQALLTAVSEQLGVGTNTVEETLTEFMHRMSHYFRLGVSDRATVLGVLEFIASIALVDVDVAPQAAEAEIHEANESTLEVDENDR